MRMLPRGTDRTVRQQEVKMLEGSPSTWQGFSDIGKPAVSKTGSPRKEEFKCEYCEMVFGTEEVCVIIRIYLKRG